MSQTTHHDQWSTNAQPPLHKLALSPSRTWSPPPSSSLSPPTEDWPIDATAKNCTMSPKEKAPVDRFEFKGLDDRPVQMNYEFLEIEGNDVDGDVVMVQQNHHRVVGDEESGNSSRCFVDCSDEKNNTEVFGSTSTNQTSITTSVRSSTFQPEKKILWIKLIKEVFNNNGNQMLRLKDIYHSFEQNHLPLTKKALNWKSSIRHTLSISPWFLKSILSTSTSTKSGYWSLNETRKQQPSSKKQRHHQIKRDRTSSLPSGERPLEFDFAFERRRSTSEVEGDVEFGKGVEEIGWGREDSGFGLASSLAGIALDFFEVGGDGEKVDCYSQKKLKIQTDGLVLNCGGDVNETWTPREFLADIFLNISKEKI